MIYELTREAREQIDNIARYTDARFGPPQTDKYLAGLYQVFELLRDNPRMGPPYDRRRRRYVYRGHHIYYRLLDDRILIVDVRSARQSPAE